MRVTLSAPSLLWMPCVGSTHFSSVKFAHAGMPNSQSRILSNARPALRYKANTQRRNSTTQWQGLQRTSVGGEKNCRQLALQTAEKLNGPLVVTSTFRFNFCQCLIMVCQRTFCITEGALRAHAVTCTILALLASALTLVVTSWLLCPSTQ